MKKMILLFLLGITNWGFSQNLIQNFNFESGSLGGGFSLSTSPTTALPGWTTGCQLQGGTSNFGTPDIYSKHYSGGSYTVESYCVPNNVLLPHSGNRYVHMFPGSTSFSGESIKGVITSPLTLTNSYQVSCYVARTFNALQMTNPNPDLRLEFVLRKDNDCNSEKIVYTSDLVLPTVYYSSTNYCSGSQSTDWKLKQGSFNLDQADVNFGYNRLEIRIKGTGSLINKIFIDDVELKTIPLVKAAYSFTNPGQTQINMSSLYGPLPVTQICSTPPKTCITINGSASTNEDGYYISITPWNMNSWQPAGSPLINQWICTNCTAGAIDLCNITDIHGVNYQPVFQNNVVYKVSLAVGSPWSVDDKYIIILPSPVIDPIPDQTICSGTSATLNVTSTEWPIAMFNGTTGATTIHASNPIVVSPVTTTTYTFSTANKNGCFAVTSTKVLVKTSPETTITGASEFCMGDPLTFTGTLTAGFSLKHLWQIQACDQNGNVLPGTSHRTTPWLYTTFPEVFTFNSLTTNMSSTYLQPGYYRIKLVTLSAETNGCWGVTSYKVIKILPKPNVSVQYPNNLDYLCNGDNVSLYLDDASFFPLTVYAAGVAVGSFISNPITLSPTSTTTYTLTSINKGTCSPTINVNVKNCPKPCFIFNNVYNQTTTSSPYGPQIIYGICLPNNVEINTSCSEYTQGCYVRISEFNIGTWTFGANLFGGWINTTGSIPTNINLTSLVGGSNVFDPAKVYIVIISTGPSWTSSPPQFFRVLNGCLKSSTAEETLGEISSLSIYPNPTKDKVRIVFDKNETGKVEIYSLEGKIVFSTEFSENNSIESDLSNYRDGVYIARITTSNGTITRKIIKE